MRRLYNGGELLEALGRDEEAQLAFCRAYRARPSEIPAYVQRFLQEGVQALQPAEGGAADLRSAAAFFRMASCVDPQNTDAREALQVVMAGLGRT